MFSGWVRFLACDIDYGPNLIKVDCKLSLNFMYNFDSSRLNSF